MSDITYEIAKQSTMEYFSGDQMASDAFIDKYALRDLESNLLEKNPDDMHRRLARQLYLKEANYPNALSEQDIYEALKDYKRVVLQGSPSAVIGDNFRIQSVSNCTVVPSPYDSYGGILESDQNLAQLMKRRCGVGIDISPIRPKGMVTTNAARTTSGIAGFMERYSNTCREVAQKGRRGALMISLDIRHPEVETFIDIKLDDTKVTGANISVRTNDEFMKAVKNNEDFTLQWPCESENPEVVKVVKARDIWNKIIHAATVRAEPGVLFWDHIINNSPADIYADLGFKTVSTNPCITSDSLIAVADGRNVVSIGELVADGVDVPVYSTNVSTGRVEIKMGRNPRKTGEKKEIWKLVLDDGTIFRATPDHRVMLRDCSYRKLKDLQPGDSVFPFNSFENNGYRQVCNIGGNTESEVEQNNLKVSSVEFTGHEDVYNITVDDNHNYHVITSHEDDGVISSGLCVKNCGEIPLCPFDSCRLTVLNLYSYVKNKFTDSAYFDYAEFKKDARIGQRLMDDIIDIELDLISSIIHKIKSDSEPDFIKESELRLWRNMYDVCQKGRRTGLGITALGDTIAALGYRYGSSESIVVTEEIYKTLAIASMEESIQLAKERGAFPICDPLKMINHPFISRVLGECSQESVDDFIKYGRRNIATTTTAPVGTISTQTQTTSGIEPAFMLSYTRNKKMSEGDIERGLKPTFIDKKGDKWIEYKVFHKPYKDWMDATGNDDVVENSPYFKSTSNDIDWKKSVDIQAVAQKWIEHSISKTCNLPAGTTEELVSEIYMRAWEKGCKGFTIYVDGCRTGVLVSNNDKRDSETFPQYDAPKRPEELDCEIHKTIYKGQEWVVLVGLLDGKPYEVFGGHAQLTQIPKNVKSGKIVKRNLKTKAKYDLVYIDGESEIFVKDIAETFDDADQSACTRMISTALRHGTSIQFVVEQLQKERNAQMFSFGRIISRVLKKYIKDGEIKGKTCDECGSDKIAYMEGCLTCQSCGISKCM